MAQTAPRQRRRPSRPACIPCSATGGRPCSNSNALHAPDRRLSHWDSPWRLSRPHVPRLKWLLRTAINHPLNETCCHSRHPASQVTRLATSQCVQEITAQAAPRLQNSKTPIVKDDFLTIKYPKLTSWDSASMHKHRPTPCHR